MRILNPDELMKRDKHYVVYNRTVHEKSVTFITSFTRRFKDPTHGIWYDCKVFKVERYENNFFTYTITIDNFTDYGIYEDYSDGIFEITKEELYKHVLLETI